MISIQIMKPGEIRIIEKEIPLISGEEVLIRIKYVGFCGSDLSSFLGRNPMVNYPVIPGHEIAGVIEGKGDAVPSGFSIGQKVTVIPYTSCGNCASCRRGRPNACQFNQTLGVQRDGAMSEYIAVPWEKIVVSDTLSLVELAIVEPLTVGFHAVSRGRVTENDTVAVLGMGIIGIGALISAINRGAAVYAVDIDDSKLDFAMSLGARGTINAKNEDLVDCLSALAGGMGPDLIIEAAGREATYLAAVSGVSFTGRVVCIGYAGKDIAFATKLFVQKELDILGSRNASTEDFNEVIRFLKKGKFDAGQIISRVLSPGEVNTALEEWAGDPGNVFKLLVEF
jgi:threonine dehydrogenase-like Zn-dependent dehydrogenase